MPTTESDLRRLAASVDEPVRAVLLRLRKDGHEAWLAGGCVRDLLLGRTPEDFDVATSARPEVVQALFPRTIPTGIQHGTVTVLVGDDHVEVTTFRGEGPYTDGRRPEHVEFITDLERDLARRDFTINAMAFDPENAELRDPFGGQADIERRVVRCVGDALARFSEDGLRPLRAVRFASTLEFNLDGPTHAAIPIAMATFRKIAVERVRDELIKLLMRSPKPSNGMKLLAETGLLAEVLPELLEGQGVTQNHWHEWDVWTHTLHTLDATPADLTIRLAALLHDIAKPRCAVPKESGEHTFHDHESIGAVLAGEILERLKLPRRVNDAVCLLVREHNWHYAPEWTDGAVRRALRRIGPENLPALLALCQADIRGRGRAVDEGLQNLAELRTRIELERERATALSIADLAITGDDLVAEFSRTPGPWIGVMLRGLLERVLDDPDANDRTKLLELARGAGEGGAINPPR